MNYKMPLIVSFILSAIGSLFLYFGHNISAQAAFVIGFLLGINAFKTRGIPISALATLLPSLLVATLYFTPGVFSFLSLALVLCAIQNIFLETFLPSKMYNSPYFRMTLGIGATILYFAGNIIYPSGWQAWTFPGIILFLANFLTALITMDMFALEKISSNGYIKTGSACPDFNLPNENGENISRGDFSGKYLLMVFVRGDWCPGCHIMLRTYQRHKEKFAEREVHLLSIGPDPLGVNKEMVEKLGLNYHILADEKQELSKQFCVELQKVIPGAPAYDFIPLPASFLVDKSGVVRYTSRADKAGEILNPAQIFAVLDSLN